MCATCGCSADTGHDAEHEHAHGHSHEAGPAHGHNHDGTHAHVRAHAAPHAPHPEARPARRTVTVEQAVMARNDRFAAENRRFFQERGILALNLLSSPGSGKTTLLVETIRRLRESRPIFVIEGDQQTSLDAERIQAAGAPAVQINTGKGCHLDAHGVGHALAKLAPPHGSLLFVENVGNLVCPAGFSLGEDHKVLVLSVTEGDEKPLKYPDAFAASSLLILNKTDLLPYVRFDVSRCIERAKQINPELEILLLSATTGEGMESWLSWLGRRGRRALPCTTPSPLV